MTAKELKNILEKVDDDTLVLIGEWAEQCRDLPRQRDVHYVNITIHPGDGRNTVLIVPEG